MLSFVHDQYPGSISSRFSGSSETDALEFLEYHEYHFLVTTCTVMFVVDLSL